MPIRHVFLFPLLVVVVVLQHASALVVSAPPIDVGATPVWRKHVEAAPLTQETPLSIRIRSTKESDLDEISTLLALASMKVAPDTPLNWKASMELLRTKASMRSQLFSRYQALREGIRAAQLHDVTATSNLDSDDITRMLWSRDAFRHKLYKATTMSSEPHMWKGHHFDIVPIDSCMLQHKLISAQDTTTGNVVGFCEVAMLSSPKHNFSECAAPTIINLVVSPQHRRKGIASDLMESAVRYAKRSWCSRDLALYVDMDNLGAIQLYEKHHFQKETSRNGQWYMTRSLQKRSSVQKKMSQQRILLEPVPV